MMKITAAAASAAIRIDVISQLHFTHCPMISHAKNPFAIHKINKM